VFTAKITLKSTNTHTILRNEHQYKYSLIACVDLLLTINTVILS